MDIVTYRPARAEGAASPSRVDWVDAAKGICIVLVVTMHATLGVEEAFGRQGFMHWVVAFSKPFRLPDFFLVSGLFLSRVIDRDWRIYADKRVVHFAYFYLLWLVIQSGVKYGQVSEGSVAGFGLHLLHSLVEPYSTLWFVYALAIFSIATKLMRRFHPALTFGLAAILQILPIETPFFFLNELCERWVFFVAGYLFAGPIFRLADRAADRMPLALCGLAAWALANGALALTPVDFHGATTLAELPVVGLLAGGAGAIAIVVLSSLLVRAAPGRALRYVGSKSLAVYLTFFLPMAFTRLLLLKLWPAADTGLVALIVIAAAVLFPLALEWLVRGTRFAFLYVRPAWAHLPKGEARAASPEAPPAPPIDLSRALVQRGRAA
jgi:uncharacterized membrane protein YcfT